jgi:hypothetical protein
LKSKESITQDLSKDDLQQEGPPDTCDCKYDWGCGWASDCLSNGGCPYNNNNNNCGFFGNDNCNGSCS